MLTPILLASLGALQAPEADAPDLPHLEPGVLTELANALLLDEPGDGRTWARSATWKASFGPKGFTYIPFFGSDAPQNYPVAFDLSSVTVGGEALALGPRDRSRADRTVSLDRGPVDEVYHLTESHVEQTFVFDALPSRSEIVLHLDVDSELTAEATEQGFAFVGDLGRVLYGSAVAVDAEGKSIGLTQRLTESGIEIVVPESFASAAALPLTIDPIVSTISITNDTRQQLDVDIAYQGDNSTYQIVFSERQSTLDFDVISVRYNASLGLTFPATSLDITSVSWTTPRNASTGEAQQYLCVSVVGFLVGNRVIWGRTQSAATGARGPQFQISGAGGEYADVGGKGNEILTVYDYMVVWQEADNINNDFDIVAQAVNSDGTLTGGRILIDPDVTDMDRVPSISKSAGRPGDSNADSEYMIVWEREISDTDHNLRGQVIEYTGNMSGHDQFSVYTFSDSLDPDVSTSTTEGGFAGERHWVVAFERRTGTDYDIFAVVARDGEADNARSVTTMQDLDNNLDHRDPTLAFDSRDYLLAYQTTSATGLQTVHYTALNVVHDGDELRTGISERRSTFATYTDSRTRFALASHFDGGGPFLGAEPGDAILVRLGEDPTSGETDVAASVIVDILRSVTGSQFCDANPNSTGESAWMAARSNFPVQAGGSLFLECSDLPQNSFGHFIVSNVSGFVPNPGGSQGNLCLQGSVGRYNSPSQILNSGSAGLFELLVDTDFIPGPGGFTAVNPGETLFFQCWFRDLGPVSNFSNGVEVTFD